MSHAGASSEFTQPLSSASPPSRALSHTPPLLPTHAVENEASALVANPLNEFSLEACRTAVSDRCLEAACSLLHFEIAEVLYCNHMILSLYVYCMYLCMYLSMYVSIYVFFRASGQNSS